MNKIKLGKETRIRVLGGQVVMRFQDPSIDDWVRGIDHFTSAAKDFTPVFKIFGPYMIQSIKRNFRSEGRPKKWKALAPATIRQRLYLGYGSGPILKRTGDLERGFWFDYGKQSLQLSNYRRYFGVHQYGSKKRNIPKRPMIVIQTADRAYFTRLCREHLIQESD